MATKSDRLSQILAADLEVVPALCRLSSNGSSSGPVPIARILLGVEFGARKIGRRQVEGGAPLQEG